MRTLLTYVGCAAASMLLLISMAWLPSDAARSAPGRPLALTQTAEPPTPTLDTSTATPVVITTSVATATSAATTPLPERPTLPPTETPTPGTLRPTLTPTPLPPPTATPAPDDGGGDPGVADPYITKRGNLDRVQVGDFVEFTLTVGNMGTAAATDVVITDPLPDFLTLYNATTTRGLISVAGNTLTVEIGTVEPGALITITILTRVNRQVAPPDNLNTATLSTSSAGDDLDNNASSAALSTVLAPTATPTVAAPPAASPTVAAPPSAPPASAPPAAQPTHVPPAVQPTRVPPAAAHPTATASAPVVLPPTGANDSDWSRLFLPLLLVALGMAVVSAVVRRRSLR